MPIDEDKLFDQVCQTWTHFAAWREKIFAGYLTVLAGLAYAFSKDAGAPVRSALFAFAILISVLFRILDIRTTGQINLCQRVGARLAGGEGVHGEIMKDRFSTSRLTTYGFAINMLVAGVIGASGAGLFIYIEKWRDPGYVPCWEWSVLAVIASIVVLIIAECYTGKIWRREKDEYLAPPKAS
jgi:hypothetical protein